MPIVAFVTHQEFPEITEDDRLAAELVRGRGVDVNAAVWDAPKVEWSRFDSVVIRSPWDYHLKPDRYAAWLRQFQSTSGLLWNPAQAVLENIDKRYLLSLAAQGIEVVPTAFQRAGSDTPLLEVLENCDWNEVVIKPTVSASGWETWRSSRATANDDQVRFARQIRARDLLIQPYMPEVAASGEWSLVFIEGRYSHAALKKPARGEFRVQRHLGGTTIRAQAGKHLIAGAERALAAVKHSLMYARVDGVERHGRFVLMELEINEPFLFLGYSERAAGLFADAIIDRL